MKLLLNQCFPLKPEGGKPDSLKINDVEYALFLAPDVQASAELRQETLRFLETQFEADAFQEASWNAHCLYLRNEKGLRKTPSFALMQWTLPVRFWIFGDCQIVCVKEDHSYTIFKPDTPTQWFVSEQWTQLRDTWLLAQMDNALLQPIAQSVAEAATSGIALEVFFYNQYLKFAHKRPITVVRVEAIVDLMAMPDSDYIKKRLNQLANSARPAAKLLIQNALSKKTIQPDWFGRVTKLEYKALETELELKRIEITLLEQQSQRSKVVELEGDLARKDLEINGLQTKIRALNDKLSDLALVRKGAEATQKELDALKKAFDQLSLEKTQLIQQLKEAQSAHNQSVTRFESLSKQFAETKLQLDNLQKEKLLLQNQLKTANTDLPQIPYEFFIKQLKTENVDLQKEKQFLRDQLEKANTYLQQIQNQPVTPYEFFIKQLKTEKVDLQRVQNESVARYESLVKQLKVENLDLQQVQNQFITQNATLSDELKTARTEIERLRKLLDLKPIPQPIVIPTPVVPKPIIITPPIIKTKLPFEPEMILVEGSTFKMGNDKFDDKEPIHQVILSSFMIGKYPITQAQWQSVMGTNPSHFKGDTLPVENVSWDDSQDFINKLNNKTGKNYRLPTESEWEFAARGGKKSKGFEYSGSNNLEEVGWFRANSGDEKLSGHHSYDRIMKNNCITHPIGEKSPSELGIHDMSGNVWEWCSDWYDSYESAVVTNPTGANKGLHRVNRGGCWGSTPEYCRTSNRNYNAPTLRVSTIGLRLLYSL
jgi:formylglycine-generating enzyme required for sulfatase activity